MSPNVFPTNLKVLLHFPFSKTPFSVEIFLKFTKEKKNYLFAEDRRRNSSRIDDGKSHN